MCRGNVRDRHLGQSFVLSIEIHFSRAEGLKYSTCDRLDAKALYSRPSTGPTSST